ncbi:MAG: radical SAM protein [Methanobacterium sp.]
MPFLRIDKLEVGDVKMEEVYPFLKEHYRLHRGPVTSYIISLDDDKGYHVLNRDAAQIVDKCDGFAPLTCIAWELSILYKEPYDEVFNDIKKYIYLHEYIGCLTEPRIDFNYKSDHWNTGSWEYHSPIHVSIELTDKCNFTCKHCYGDCDNTKNNFINTDVILKNLIVLHSMGVGTVEITGGEPSLHPDFILIVKHALDLFDIVAVITNGFLIGNDTLMGDDLAVLSRCDGNIIFQVDLHGCKQDFVDEFCGKTGAFDNAKNAIKKLSETFNVQVTMCVIPENITQLFDTAQLAKSLGAVQFVYSVPVPVGRGKYIDLQFSQEQLEVLEQEIVKVKNELNDFIFEMSHSQFDAREIIPNCGAGSRSISIASNAKIKLCPMMPNSDFIFGNLYEEKLEEIFARNMLKYFSELKNPNSYICRGCKHLEFCDGCITRGLLKAREIKAECIWATNYMIKKIPKECFE